MPPVAAEAMDIEDVPARVTVYDTLNEPGSTFAEIAACVFLILFPSETNAMKLLSQAVFEFAYASLARMVKTERSPAVVVDNVVPFTTLWLESVLDGKTTIVNGLP